MKTSLKLIAAIFFALFLGPIVGSFFGVAPFVGFVGFLALEIALSYVRIPGGSLAESLGPLTASNPTTFTLDYIPSYIVVGTVDADIVVNAITAAYGGKTFQEIDDQQVIQAISRLMMKSLLGADVKVGSVLKFATGEIPVLDGQKFKLTLGNAGATAPVVYAFSDKDGGKPIKVGQDSINARGNVKVSGVSYLLFEDTNYSKADIIYKNGHTEANLSLVELASMLAMDQNTDADGKLAGVNVIDLDTNGIAQVTLYAGTGGSLPYYTVSI